MADFDNLPDLEVSTESFRTTFANLLALKVNKFSTTTEATANVRPVAQWGNLIDGIGVVLQEDYTERRVDGMVRVGDRRVYAVASDPEGSQVASPGDIALRSNGALYRKASGTGTDTGWVEITSGTTPGWDEALAEERTSGATSPQISTGQVLEHHDGTRVRVDTAYASDDYRVRTYTAAGAAAGTFTLDAAATPVMTWNGRQVLGTATLGTNVQLAIGAGSVTLPTGQIGGAPDVGVTVSSTTANQTVGVGVGVTDGSRNTRAVFYVTDAPAAGGEWGLSLAHDASGLQPFAIYLAATRVFTIDTSNIAHVVNGLRPITDDTGSLGSASRRWADVRTMDLHVDDEAIVEGNLTVNTLLTTEAASVLNSLAVGGSAQFDVDVTIDGPLLVTDEIEADSIECNGAAVIEGLATMGAGIDWTATSTAALSSGTVSDLVVANIATVSVLRLAADNAGTTLTGIVPPASPAGRVYLFINTSTAGTLTLSHDVTSTAANRFFLSNGASLAIRPYQMFMLWYDTSSSRWRVMS